MLSYLLERTAWALRVEQSKAKIVTVKLRYADFETVSKAKSLAAYSDQDDDFLPVALELLNKLYTRPTRVRLIGICLSGLAKQTFRQSTLWQEREYYRLCRMYETLDKLRWQYGFKTITYGKSIDLITHQPKI